MTRQPSWTVWIDHPCSLGRGQRGFASIEEAIRLVYRNEITYEGWLWEYHRVTIAVARRSRAEAIAMALLAMHVQHIREDTRLPWSGACRFDLTQGDEQPEWVQAYERARIARMREEQR